MTYPTGTLRFNRDRGDNCPKCSTDNYQGNRKVQFVPAREDTVAGGSGTIKTPEYVVVYCYNCGFQINKYKPADARKEDIAPIT